MAAKINWDAFGVATSVACAIHCAVLPLLISSLPVLGFNIIHNSFFEWGMIALAFAIGAYALRHGHVKHHRSFTPVIIFCVGFLFLVLKQFFPSLEYIFLFFAVTFILTAHFLNYRLSGHSASHLHGHN